VGFWGWTYQGHDEFVANDIDDFVLDSRVYVWVLTNRTKDDFTRLFLVSVPGMK